MQYCGDINAVLITAPRTYVRREVMFSQVCVCSGGVGGGEVGGVPGLRFLGGYQVSNLWGGTRSQLFWRGVYQVSDFWRGGPGLKFLGRGGTRSQIFRGGYLVSVKGKLFDTRFGLIHVQTGKIFFVKGPPPGISRNCYGYMVGGMPLAFTQEDFLVVYYHLGEVTFSLCYIIIFQIWISNRLSNKYHRRWCALAVRFNWLGHSGVTSVQFGPFVCSALWLLAHHTMVHCYA